MGKRTAREIELENASLREALEEAYDRIGDALGVESESDDDEQDEDEEDGD